jgi:hypothetical protein
MTNYTAAIIFIFTFFFFLGAFTSNFIAESVAIKRPNLSHVIPISLEITIFCFGWFFFGGLIDLSSYFQWIAFSILYFP